MPYVNKKRPYKKEYQQQKKRKKEKERRKLRQRARRRFDKENGKEARKGKDLHHKKPLSKGGGNSKSNVRLVSSKSNRTYARRKDHKPK